MKTKGQLVDAVFDISFYIFGIALWLYFKADTGFKLDLEGVDQDDDISNVAVRNGYRVLANDYKPVVSKVELSEEFRIDLPDHKSLLNCELLPQVQFYIVVFILVSLDFDDFRVVLRLLQRLVERLIPGICVHCSLFVCCLLLPIHHVLLVSC